MSTPSEGSEDPACSTRSGHRKRRNAEKDAEFARRVQKKTEVTEMLHIDTERQAKEDSMRRMTVQERRVYSVAAHCARYFCRFEDRMRQVADLYGTQKTRQTTIPWNNGFVRHEKKPFLVSCESRNESETATHLAWRFV